MKKIFVVDWILLIVAALSAYSGIELHVAGHVMCTKYGIIGRLCMC